MAQCASKVVILATGGTIVSSGASATQMTGYSIQGLGVDDLLSAVPMLADAARVEAAQVSNIDSSSMTSKVWMTLARAVQDALDREDVSGVVITHGTDTMEETAWFLNLVLKSEKPVVLTGAMRPATALSAEGPLNLLNAVRIAADPRAAGRGVMIALNDVIVSARDATKTHPTNVATFRGPDLGMIGMIAGTHVDSSAAAIKPHTAETPFTLEALEAHVKAHGALPRRRHRVFPRRRRRRHGEGCIGCGAAGIVHAGTGNGSIHEAALPALHEAAAAGVLVIRASRTGSGMTVEGLAEWQAAGFIPSGTLNPQKARVLVQLCLVCGVDAKDAFARF